MLFSALENNNYRIYDNKRNRKRNYSKSNIQKLCEGNRISGVAKFGRLWLIPKDAEKLTDQRKREEKESENIYC